MSMAESLPETIIHRVQSSLPGKKAAQTTLLSKSWRSAWLTRRRIDLDESNFLHASEDIDGLTDFANKTFQRYEESNLTIDAFSLCLSNESYYRFGFAKDWTLKALKLGATDFTFRFPDSSTQSYGSYGYRNVERLCMQCLVINQLEVIKCCNQLTSLTLSNLTLKTDQFFDLILCFPSIEYLSLSHIHCNEQQVAMRSSPPTILLLKLRSLVLSGFESQFQMKMLFLDDLSSKFPNLKDLTLGFNSHEGYSHKTAAVEIRNISSGTLETLNLRCVDSMGGVNYIGEREKVAVIKLDLPSIRKLTFEGSCMPNLCFSPTPIGDQLDSHVSIRNFGDLSNKWFSEFGEFLTNLKGSRIHLCLHLDFNADFDYDVGELGGLNVFEVDDLTLDAEDVPSLSCYAFLDGLFRTCHPKMITQYVGPSSLNVDKVYRRGYNSDLGKNRVNDLHIVPLEGAMQAKLHVDKVYRRGYNPDRGKNRVNDLHFVRSLEQAMQAKSSLLIPTQFLYGLRELEELDAQQLIDDVWEQRPLGSLLADLEDIKEQQLRRKTHPNGPLLDFSKRRFRLLLKWRE